LKPDKKGLMAQREFINKQIKPIIFTLSLIIGLTLLIWTVKPLTKVQNRLMLFSPDALLNNNSDCTIPIEWEESTILISYPNTIRQGDSLPIFIEMELKPKQINEEVPCSLNFEVNADAQQPVSFKDIRITEKFTGQSELSFSFELNPIRSSIIEGTIWVFLLIKEDNNPESLRSPILAIPFSVIERSYFSLGYPFFQFLAIILILFSIIGLISHLFRKYGWMI
jgi:hypothetical protein